MKSIPAALPISVLFATAFGGSALVKVILVVSATNSSVVSNLVQIAFSAIAILILVAVAMRTAPQELYADLSLPMTLSSAILVAGVGLVLLPFRISVETLFEIPLLMSVPDAAQHLYRLRPLDDVNSTGFFPPLVMITGLLAQVIVGPVLEEFVFRGGLLGRWAATKGPMVGLLLSSILFAFLHYPRVASSFGAGLVFGLLYLRFGTLIAPILAHIVTNLCAFSLAFVTERPWEKDLSDVLNISNWWFEIGCMAVTLVFVFALLLLCERHELLSLEPIRRDRLTTG